MEFQDELNYKNAHDLKYLTNVRNMRNINRIFIVLVILVVYSETFAQTFRLRGGLNSSTMIVKDKTLNIDNRMHRTGHFGGALEIPIKDWFSLEAGVQYIQKGMNYNYNGQDFNIRLDYLDIPLSAKGTYAIDMFNLYGILGLYLDFELQSDQQLKKFDYGLNIGGGIEYYRFQLGCTYGLGLRNIAYYNANETSIKNKVLGISLGFRFGKIKKTL